MTIILPWAFIVSMSPWVFGVLSLLCVFNAILFYKIKSRMVWVWCFNLGISLTLLVLWFLYNPLLYEIQIELKVNKMLESRK